MGKDFPRTWELPPLEDVYMSRENSAHYAFNATLSDLEWKHLLPSNGGIISFGDRSQPQRFTISLFHQIKCLDIIRRSLLAFRGPERRRPDHLTHHCMNYLRQMVLCRSNIDLESIHTHQGPRVTLSEVTHQCRDWEAVYASTEANIQVYN